jgi:hypothetical protein
MALQLHRAEQKIRLTPQQACVFCGESYTGECLQASVGADVFRLLLLFLQIIQQLPEHEHPEGTDMGARILR